MTVKEMAEYINIHSTNLSHYKLHGIIPNYPPGYKKMDEEQLRPYLDECKQIIIDYRKGSHDRRSKSLSKKRDIKFELPDYLVRLEREQRGLR